jgi:iron-sulfur cluster assembly accessory protein
MEMTIETPVTFTQNAVQEIRRLMEEPIHSPAQFLRVGVKGGGCTGLSYILGFDDKAATDEVYEANGIQFIMNPAHAIYLTGVEINWEGGLNARGFTFINPNASKTCGCGSSFAV